MGEGRRPAPAVAVPAGDDRGPGDPRRPGLRPRPGRRDVPRAARTARGRDVGPAVARRGRGGATARRRRLGDRPPRTRPRRVGPRSRRHRPRTHWRDPPPRPTAALVRRRDPHSSSSFGVARGPAPERAACARRAAPRSRRCGPRVDSVHEAPDRPTAGRLDRSREDGAPLHPRARDADGPAHRAGPGPSDGGIGRHARAGRSPLGRQQRRRDRASQPDRAGADCATRGRSDRAAGAVQHPGPPPRERGRTCTTTQRAGRGRRRTRGATTAGSVGAGTDGEGRLGARRASREVESDRVGRGRPIPPLRRTGTPRDPWGHGRSRRAASASRVVHGGGPAAAAGPIPAQRPRPPHHCARPRRDRWRHRSRRRSWAGSGHPRHR